jgi:hypothetical protein
MPRAPHDGDGDGGCGGDGVFAVHNPLFLTDRPLPEALVRNVRRFADTLGEVLEVPWARLGLMDSGGGEDRRGGGFQVSCEETVTLSVGWAWIEQLV